MPKKLLNRKPVKIIDEGSSCWQIEEISSASDGKVLWYEASMIEPKLPEQCGHYPFIKIGDAEEFIESKNPCVFFKPPHADSLSQVKRINIQNKFLD